MPERMRKLQLTLDELEEELRDMDSVDAETRQVLEEAAREIQAALAKQAPHDLESHSLTERLRDAASRFESSHPNVSAIVGRLIDGLGQMGI